jgi:hypothetical protein
MNDALKKVAERVRRGLKLVPLSQVPGFYRAGDRYGRELLDSPLFRSKEDCQRWIDDLKKGAGP